MCAVLIYKLPNVSVVGSQEKMSSFPLVERQCKECYSCLFAMDHSVAQFSVSLYSRFNFLPLLNASIEGNVKKTALERQRQCKEGVKFCEMGDEE